MSPDEIEHELRKEWWFNHGCDASLYGDDGEMQCACGDYKREPLDVLRARTSARRAVEAAAIVAADQAEEKSRQDSRKRIDEEYARDRMARALVRGT